MKPKSKWFPIKFSGVWRPYEDSFWRSIFGIYIYDWDETPKGFTIKIIGFNFDFRLGKWED